MICKDDIPDTFWHNEGNANGLVSHEFPDHSFLDGRLLLNQQVDIENFVVAEHELYETVYKFSSGPPTVTVGLGEMEVETKPYLRLTREAKAVGEKDFKGCVQGRKTELVRRLQELM